MLCPDHRTPLISSLTEWGQRWSCPAEGCTVASWGRKTSTPADAETRQARREAHLAFDPLWQSKLMTRSEAYERLAEFMGKKHDETHIGMFDFAECRRVLDFTEQFKKQTKGTA